MEAWKEKMHGSWKETSGKLKQKFGALTDDDLRWEEGKEEEMLGRIERKTGQAKEKIKEWIDKL